MGIAALLFALGFAINGRRLFSLLSAATEHPWGFAFGLYFTIGFLVVFYIVVRGRLVRRDHGRSPADRAFRGFSTALLLSVIHPLVVALAVALWPLWIFGVWALASDLADENEDS